MKLREYFRDKGPEGVDLQHLFKAKIFRVVQSRDLQRTVTSSGVLMLFKTKATEIVPALITSLLDLVHSTDIKSFSDYLTAIFKPYDQGNSQKISLKDFATLIENRFQISWKDPNHYALFFKDYIEGETVEYPGFVNRVLCYLFPGLEDNIE